jgi:glycosyltransferase involved in cell wall biosynthesis
MKTVLFFDSNLNERGTSVSTYDYAHFNETILGNKSIIASFKTGELTSYNKFKERFGEIHLVDNFIDLEKIKCDYVYNQKFGFNDNNIVSTAKNLIHAVFPSYQPHGDVYAYISKWLSNNIQYGKIKCEFTATPNPSDIKEELLYVPYMISLPDVKEDFKEFFNVKDKLIIGWYGGNNFHIPDAQQAVADVAKKRKDIVFIFMNQQEAFSNEDNILFINGTTDIEQKVAFINTCDVMIHARERGETFGLAIGEFSTKNKPIITYGNSWERNHIDTLGDKGIYYYDYNSLYNILMNIQKSDIEGKEWNCYQEYTPEKVMEQFNKIFLS